MSHEKEPKGKPGKKAPAKTLKEKRADKATKRDERSSDGSSVISPFAKPKK